MLLNEIGIYNTLWTTMNTLPPNSLFPMTLRHECEKRSFCIHAFQIQCVWIGHY